MKTKYKYLISIKNSNDPNLNINQLKDYFPEITANSLSDANRKAIADYAKILRESIFLNIRDLLKNKKNIHTNIMYVDSFVTSVDEDTVRDLDTNSNQNGVLTDNEKTRWNTFRFFIVNPGPGNHLNSEHGIGISGYLEGEDVGQNSIGFYRPGSDSRSNRMIVTPPKIEEFKNSDYYKKMEEYANNLKNNNASFFKTNKNYNLSKLKPTEQYNANNISRSYYDVFGRVITYSDLIDDNTIKIWNLIIKNNEPPIKYMHADKITYRNGPRENYSYKNLRFETLLKKEQLLPSDYDIPYLPTALSVNAPIVGLVPTTTVAPQSDTGSNIFMPTHTTTSVVSTRVPQRDTGTNSFTPSATPENQRQSDTTMVIETRVPQSDTGTNSFTPTATAAPANATLGNIAADISALANASGAASANATRGDIAADISALANASGAAPANTTAAAAANTTAENQRQTDMTMVIETRVPQADTGTNVIPPTRTRDDIQNYYFSGNNPDIYINNKNISKADYGKLMSLQPDMRREALSKIERTSGLNIDSDKERVINSYLADPGNVENFKNRLNNDVKIKTLFDSISSRDKFNINSIKAGDKIKDILKKIENSASDYSYGLSILGSINIIEEKMQKLKNHVLNLAELEVV